MKRLLALALTVLIMGTILASVNRSELAANLRATRPVPFLVAMLLFMPQNLIIILRWRFLATRFTPLTFANSAGMILAGASMNVLLPSKLGDLTKAVFLYRSGALDLPRATGLVVFEKMLDVGSLCILAVLGAAGTLIYGLGPGDSASGTLALFTMALSTLLLALFFTAYFAPMRWIEHLASPRARDFVLRAHEIIRLLRERHSSPFPLIFFSLALWILHLAQIFFFFLCLNAPVPLAPFAGLMPLAIFVGLLPISLFGIGTRDWAIITLFSAYHSAPILAGVGLYTSLRYLVPAMAGLPFLPRYIGWSRDFKQAR